MLCYDNFVHASMVNGVVPVRCKQSPDPNDSSNFHLIPKLPLLSKIPGRKKKVLISHVFNNIMLTDSGGHTVTLVLLDLTAVFDTEDHEIRLCLKFFCIWWSFA